MSTELVPSGGSEGDSVPCLSPGCWWLPAVLGVLSLGTVVTGPDFGSAHLPCSKVNLLTPGYGEGKYSVYCRHQARSKGSSCSEDLNSLMVFREAFLKAIFGGEGGRMRDFLLIGWW